MPQRSDRASFGGILGHHEYQPKNVPYGPSSGFLKIENNPEFPDPELVP